jgi:hypothetical protein
MWESSQSSLVAIRIGKLLPEKARRSECAKISTKFQMDWSYLALLLASSGNGAIFAKPIPFNLRQDTCRDLKCWVHHGIIPM